MIIEEQISHFIFKTVAIIILLISLFFVINNEYIIYEVYADGAMIGYISDKSKVDVVFDELKSDLNISGTVNSIKNNFTYKKINGRNIKLTSSDELKENIKQNLNIEIKAFKFVINNKEIGYISKIEQHNDIIKKIAEKYLEANNFNREDVKSINITTNGKYIEANARLYELSQVDEMAEKILDLYNKENNRIVNIELKISKKEILEISPTTIIKPTGTLYLGESKTIKGISGSKEVISILTYKNSDIISRNKIKEKIIVMPKDTIIYRGTKNPVVEGMAFLSKPSRGYISSNYGSRWGGVHHGIDIAGKIGEPIGAAFEGTVIEVKYSPIYGNYIKIKHDCGIETIYGHCSKVTTKEGVKVKRGEVIGKIGSTGKSTGPHLHFELRVNGEAINPTKYIK